MRKLFGFFFTLLFLLALETSYAIEPKAPVKNKTEAFYMDSTTVRKQTFNSKQLQQYSTQKEFKYDDIPVEGQSAWERFWQWIWRSIAGILHRLSSNKSTWFLFKLALFVMAAGAIAYAIFKIAGIDVVGLLKGNSKSIDIPYDESLENIHDINFDGEIEKAITNRNYRLAVRLLYLRALKQLSDAQLIHWQLDKTNASYITELADTTHRQTFSLLTKQFEYIWYGDFPVDGQSFQNINTLFIDFKKGIS